MRSALELLGASSKDPYIPFGCRVLDMAIGGVHRTGITEISGEAGSGKTQLCLVLALQAVLQQCKKGQMGATAIMSCGEGPFPIRRLSQLAERYETKYAHVTQNMVANDYLGQIHIEECSSTDQAVDTLHKKLPEMCQKLQLQLIIIDSLAGLVRFEYDCKSSSEMRERTAFLFQISRQLKWLSDTFRVAVVVVNQVCASGDNAMGGQRTDGNAPALGLAWSHCVNHRIFLERSVLAQIVESSRQSLEALVKGEVTGPLEEQVRSRIAKRPRDVTDSSSVDLGVEPEEEEAEDNDDGKEGARGGAGGRQDKREGEHAREDRLEERRWARSGRIMKLICSPCRPCCAVEYHITADGVVGLGSDS